MSRAGVAPTAHLVFDFNGTLLDDNAPRLRALNDSLIALGVPAIDMETFRRTFCVPVPRFYAALIGRELTQEEWLTADGVFQRNYLEYAPAQAELAPGALDALAAWTTAGHTASLLSLHTHQELAGEVGRLGLSPWLVRVDGRRGPTGGTKAEAMRRHVERLELPPARIVAIGDTRDDARSAAAAGVRAALYSGGAEHADCLVDIGVPVSESLYGAVEQAARLLDVPLSTRSAAVNTTA
ncbi:HAD family hydrolase [Streptomyces sp. NRRL B-1347]|uniref:HAD family hydrolase n=1 Tax=Streptomyces sp. NRRL B-1347 TaxID=1476877 RepID=UPI00068D6C92|nr:HAD family hydrolase [Streptomyces sp. NRRL B-1347]